MTVQPRVERKREGGRREQQQNLLWQLQLVWLLATSREQYDRVNSSFDICASLGVLILL